MNRSALLLIGIAVLISACSQVEQSQTNIVEAPQKTSIAISDKVAIETGDVGTYQRAIISPLYDLNLIKQEIPEELLNIRSVYHAPQSCSAARREVILLDAILGRDNWDMANIDEQSKKADTVTINIADLVSKVLSYNIPYDSVLRWLSGASKHEKKLAAAILRGQSRRTFLKGYLTTPSCWVNEDIK